MKNTFKYLLPAAMLVAAASGCMKSNADTTTVPAPLGTFSGQFTSLHKKSGGTGTDTVKAQLQVIFTNKGLFRVTGDTTKHAGSHGSFGVSSIYLTFVDSTLTTTNINTKAHLAGTFQYGYDGTALQFTASNDTLLYFYDLKKISN